LKGFVTFTLDSFKTITATTEGSFREKGSKFLSFVFPVENDTDIRANINALEKKYFDARHHCYAYILGAEKKIFRAFDDGEPNHSAGDPILGQIRSRDITNVLVVVVRYFGGVKLGVGGLVAAYRTAAALALDAATIIEKPILEQLQLSYEYLHTPVVMKLIKDYELKVIDEQFAHSCLLVVQYMKKHEKALHEKLQLLNATGSEIKWH
jgi:uncharacterized YigZ family protein